MSLTIIGGVSRQFPLPFASPIVELFPTWDALQNVNGITPNPEYVLVSLLIQTGNQPSTCEIERRYGNVKFPHDANFNTVAPVDLTNWWARVSMISDQGQPVVQFLGQVQTSSRMLIGSNVLPAGVQRWIVEGGLKQLQRITVSEAGFIDDDTGLTTKVGWVPSMNAHDQRGMLVGNRSIGGDSFSPCYYGGTTVWTHYDYLQYIVGYFVQQPFGPTWTIGGQTDILTRMQTTIDWPASITVAEMLHHLIPVKYGVDFRIVPTDAGYEIQIFALLATEFAIAGSTMPANPDTVNVLRTGDISLIETHVVESTERRVDKVRVQGKRIVVCGTLKGDAVGGTSWVKKWSDAIEATYISADGFASPDNPAVADAIRLADKYRDVYSHFGVPSPWDMDGGRWNCCCRDDGYIVTSQRVQDKIRRTLTWLPLKEGFDYSKNPAADIRSDTSQIPDFRPPLALVYDSFFLDGDGNSSPRWFHADKHGVGVHIPHNDWGLSLQTHPRHRMALDLWTNAQIETTLTKPADVDYPWFDYSYVYATIAIESNFPLSLTYTLPAGLMQGDGSVMTIVDEGAEAWILLPNTVVDVNPSGQPVYSGATQIELRNDLSRLALLMAGAVTKYITERFRCQLVSKGFFVWGGLLGNILTAIQQGDDVQQIGAPITSIEWILSPSPQTIVKTGYA